MIEVLPPAVNTDLGVVGLHTFGVPLNDFADAVFNELESGKENRLHATRNEFDEVTRQAWKASNVKVRIF
ncbi:hypothetical protein ABE28_019965 [Peribacillus muralis]|uniref:Uncharacterized protein n=1 Tax=Peribacillus muralis TaxID=264697 RepID=A0A1B3XTV8_9BACI|nr:hypothetical protein [Peribacillus muralis]AOH56650.1 hypothetical protein ABE28_019965 [Peribacillus muralis]